MITIYVGTGLAIKNSKILLARRRPGTAMGYAWETPGGKFDRTVDLNFQQTVKREWHEELACDVTVGELVGTKTLYLDKELELWLYEVYLNNEPVLGAEHDRLEWIEPEFAVRNLICTPGFYGLYRPIRDFVQMVIEHRRGVEPLAWGE